MIASGAALADNATSVPQPPQPRTVSFQTDEGTAMNIDVSADGSQIVFDLLGDLYVVPAAGGKARLVAGGPSWDFQPRYSPGGKILFVSDRSGSDELWTIDADSANPQRLMSGEGWSLRAPAWSVDGSSIAVHWGKPGAGLTLLDVPTGVPRSFGLPDGEPQFTNPTFAHDSRHLYFTEHGCRSSGPNKQWGRIVQLDRSTGERTALTQPGVRAFKPLVSRTGRWLAFIAYPERGVPAMRLRSLSDGGERDLITLPEADEPCRWGMEDFLTNYAFVPDDSAVVLSIGGKIHRIELATGRSAIVPFRATVDQTLAPQIPPRKTLLDTDSVQIRGIRTPRISPDGRILVFSAVGKLWVQDIQTQRIRRLTSSEELEYAPAISPDGRWLAYLSYTDAISDLLKSQSNRRLTLTNRVMVVELREGAARGTPRPITPQPGDYGAPLWFPTSDRLLFTRVEADPAQHRSVRSRFVRANVEGTELEAAGLAPAGWEFFADNMQFDERFSRAISSDGHRAYYMDLDKTATLPRLASIRIADGADQRIHLTFPGYEPPWQADESAQAAALSPDARHLLISPGRGAGLHVVAVPPADAPPMELSFASGSTRQLTDRAVTDLSWQNATTSIYSVGPAITRVTLNSMLPAQTWSVGLSLPRAKPAGSFAIRNAKLITMAGLREQERVIEQGTLLVKDGIIVQVGDADEIVVPERTHVIDGRGLTLIPGLADVHMHLRLRVWPRPVVDPDDISVLAYGVTLRYDALSASGTPGDLEHDERIRTGYSVGPRYFYAGRPIRAGRVKPGGHGGSPALLAACRNVVSWLDALGVVILKGDYRWARHEQQCWAQAAREVGIGITAHTEGLPQALTMIADGFTAWEHAKFDTPLYKDVLTLVAQSGIHHSPTTGLISSDAGDFQGWSYYYKQLLESSPEEIHKLERFVSRQALERSYRPVSLPFEKLYLGRVAQSVAALVNAGANVSVDGHNPPGILTHWAMWALGDGGTSAMDALRVATRQGAEKLGLGAQLGTLEPGKFADFVILTANPLQDIRNSLEIKYVVTNGFIYDGDTMARVWPDPRPPPQITAVP